MSHLGIDGLRPEAARPRHKHGRACLSVLVAFAVIVALGVFAYVKGVSLLENVFAGPADYPGSGYGVVVIDVKPGTGTDIGRQLQAAGVVKSVGAFTDAYNTSNKATQIEAGLYRLHKHMSGKSALALMLDPKSKVTCPTVTIPEGYRATEILQRVTAKTGLSQASLTKAYSDTSALGLPAYANKDAEGYLFPATYNVCPGTTAPQLLQQMVTRFKQEAQHANLVAGAKSLGMSPRDVIIVASLVQAEARRAQDMPKVARVVYNRLKINMPLAFDSTLHYAVDSRGVIAAGPKLRDIKSPYNTYKYPGLPPTAIDSPGDATIQAALHPSPGTWKYFVTVNLRTGDTRFATTWAQAQHNEQLYYTYCQTSSAC
ncbi:MAG: endolytic transglycosylase MltG [Nocardioidaceae bacterium]